MKHIIEGRYEKDRLPENEITAILHLVRDVAEKGTPSVEQPKYINGKNVGRIGIEKDGIIAFVSRERDGKDEKFIITGFALNNKKPEAADAIQTVIARYGYTPEFSDFRKQVGAVIASINTLSQTERDLSSNRDGDLTPDIPTHNQSPQPGNGPENIFLNSTKESVERSNFMENENEKAGLSAEDLRKTTKTNWLPNEAYQKRAYAVTRAEYQFKTLLNYAIELCYRR